MYKEINESVKLIRKYVNIKPRFGIILGSGLGQFASSIQDRVIIKTKNIPHFPHSTVEGHEGNLIFGFWDNTPLVALQGRTHFYEGHNVEKTTYSVRIMANMGIKVLIVTNAAGGVNFRFSPGDLMLIFDQINMMFNNPLIGELKYGPPRFPDMSSPFAVEFYDKIEKKALENCIILKKGVLCASTGPTYETKSEIKMMSKIGADAVSMSTIPEVIVANHAGLKVIGVSCITNMATGIKDSFLDHAEVTETAQNVSSKFKKLIGIIINCVNKEINLRV